MKLTKGKISKLYNKNKQSLKRGKQKKRINKGRTFRKHRRVHLARKSLRRLKYNKVGGANENIISVQTPVGAEKYLVGPDNILTSFSEPIPPPPTSAVAPTSAAPPTSAAASTNVPTSNGILGDNEMVFNGVGKDFYNAWIKAQEISKRPQNPEKAVGQAALRLADNIQAEAGQQQQIEAGQQQQIEARPSAPPEPLTPEEELSIRPPADSMEKIRQQQDQAIKNANLGIPKIYQLFDEEKKIYYYFDPINLSQNWVPPKDIPVVVLLTGVEKVLDRDAIQRAFDKDKAKNV
jgi:hypothetical protein